ncbi:hypothetical protein PPACK8108_LOCUS12667, partial [Phakopsora pachyrhizi]
KYKSLCLSEMAQHNIQHPTFQWDVEGQTRWDGLVIDILVKHWLYAKNKEAFQEYPLQSDFCTKTIVSAIVERWLRGQKASYGKDKITNQNLSRIKKKLFQNRLHMAKKLLGCETASQIIPHMNCISDTEEDEDGNLLCIESNWRHNKYSLLLHFLTQIQSVPFTRKKIRDLLASPCTELFFDFI